MPYLVEGWDLELKWVSFWGFSFLLLNPYIPGSNLGNRIILFLLVPYRCFTGGDFRFTLRPCVRLSDCPSAKSGSCDNLKTVWSLLMKLYKWIDEKVEIMHVLLFCSSTINFGCYVSLKFLFRWLIMGEIVDPAITETLLRIFSWNFING